MPISARQDLDLRDLDDGFREMLRAARNLKPVWRKLEIPMAVDQESHFETRSSSSGKGWPAKKASTIKRDKSKSFPRRNKSRKPLGNKMKTAFEIVIKPKEIAASSLVDWADAHQFGLRVGRGVKLPVREHIYMSETFLQRATKDIQIFLIRKFGRRFA